MTVIGSGPAPGVTHAAIVERELDVSGLVQMVADPGSGATAVFLGTVRDNDAGRPVIGIDYQAYSAMAARELHAIVTEAAHQFGTRALAIEHRSGFLAVGEISVVIVASHEHRGPAFDATRYVIEQIKRRVPIWKREHYADGTREWVDPTHSSCVPGADAAAEARP